jgi:hypothetical protein
MNTMFCKVKGTHLGTNIGYFISYFVFILAHNNNNYGPFCSKIMNIKNPHNLVIFSLIIYLINVRPLIH